MTQIIHIWMRLYSLNKHPKFDDNNHPHLDEIVLIQNLMKQIIHIWMTLVY